MKEFGFGLEWMVLLEGRVVVFAEGKWQERCGLLRIGWIVANMHSLRSLMVLLHSWRQREQARTRMTLR